MKRDPRLADLTRDHHHALVLALTLRRALRDGSDLREPVVRLLHQFADEIEPHFRVEEATLVPALRALGKAEQALAQRVEHDHAALRAGVQRAERGETAHLAAWAQLLDDHVRFEERELFERAQAVLPAAALDAVRSVWLQTPQARRQALGAAGAPPGASDQKEAGPPRTARP